MLLGVHVSAAGRIYEAVEKAHALGCGTMQFFSRNPQQWRSRGIDEADAREFRRRRDQYGIRPVFIHIPYLINLASPDPRLYKDSIVAYIEDIADAGKLGVDHIVTHMGSHKQTSEEEGLSRLSSALGVILDATKKSGVGILLENTSGSGSWLGYDFAHQQRVMEELNGNQRIGLCLDTAHAYLAGYDIASAQGLERLLADIDRTAGMSRIRLIHLNDAQGTLGSHADRHAHIGKGAIGAGGIRRIINHPRLRDLPFVLETPKDTGDADVKNLRAVRRLREKI